MFPGVIHIHSNYSSDSQDPLERIRETSIQRGIRFVGMSEHAEDLTEEIYQKYLQHCADVSNNQVHIIPGLEYRFEEFSGMHLFALGLRKWITPNTPEEFIEQTRGICDMTVLAHPILAKYEIPPVVLDHIDAIEVWNASYNTRFLPDPKAIHLYHNVYRRRPNVVATVGLDQHDAFNDRQTRVVLPHPSPDPIGELKAGRFVNIGRTMKFDARVSMSANSLYCLGVTRRVYDVVERAHDRTLLWFRRVKAGNK